MGPRRIRKGATNLEQERVLRKKSNAKMEAGGLQR